MLVGLEVIPLEKCINIFAEIKTKLKQEGKLIDNFDLLIASTVIAHDLTLVTRNTKHFERIENLELENWIKQ